MKITSDNIGSGWSHLIKKINGESSYEKKLFMATKPTSKSNSHNKNISQITVGSMLKKVAPWTFNPKTKIQIPGELFQQSPFIEVVD